MAGGGSCLCGLLAVSPWFLLALWSLMFSLPRYGVMPYQQPRRPRTSSRAALPPAAVPPPRLQRCRHPSHAAAQPAAKLRPPPGGAPVSSLGAGWAIEGYRVSYTLLLSQILFDVAEAKIKISTGKQALSHPSRRLLPIDQWEGDPDQFLT